MRRKLTTLLLIVIIALVIVFPVQAITPTGRAATIIVAASNASAIVKEQADYVADGTDDQVEINTAIGTDGDARKKVYLSEGDFHISAPILSRSQMILEGAGMEATRIYNHADNHAITGTGVRYTRMSDFSIYSSVNMSYGIGIYLPSEPIVYLPNIRVIGHYVGALIDHPIVTELNHVFLQENVLDGLIVGGVATSVSIINSYFSGNGRDGSYFENVYYFAIIGGAVDANGRNGYNFFHSQGSVSGSGAESNINGFYTSGGSNITFSAIYTTGNSHDGVQIADADTIVINGFRQDAGFNGLEIWPSAKVWATGLNITASNQQIIGTTQQYWQ